MIDLLLAILFFNLILILFKLFERYQVDNLQAIVCNYAIAGSLGFATSQQTFSAVSIFKSEWIYYALMVGFLFVLVFNLLAKATQKIGLSLATVANKTSVILPIIASFFLYNDEANFTKIIGILFAILAVVLSALKGGKLSFDRQYLWLIIVIFMGQGVADILFNYAQVNYVAQENAPLFLSTLFISAFLTGIFILLIKMVKSKEKLKLKNIFWGIGVGIPNYLTMFFFFRALENGNFESSIVYPLLNIGVIVLSAIAGLVLFKERLTGMNWLGVVVAIFAILSLSANL